MRYQLCLGVWIIGVTTAPAWANPTWVQWPVNNHLYAVIVVPDGISWSDANAAAQALQGHLVSVNSAAENDFVFNLIDDPQYWKPHVSFTDVEFNIGPWIGGYQAEVASEPNGDWQWTSGEQFNFEAWFPGEPNEAPIPGEETENRICYWVQGSLTERGNQWNDYHENGCWDGDCVIAFIVERGCATSNIDGPAAQSVCPGSTATFNVEPTGEGPFTYLWHKAGQPLEDDNRISGSQTDTLTISDTIAADAGLYACLVANSCGPVLSAAAELLLIPAIIIHGPSAQDVCPGGTATFQVEADGVGPFTYLWQKDGQPLTDDGRMTGSDTDTLTITDVTASDVDSYACLVTNSCESVLSATADLSIIPTLTVDGPSEQVVCAGGTAIFAVTPIGAGPFTYAWRKGGQPLEDDVHVTGSNTATLTISAVTAADVDSYACLVTDACGTELSDAADLLIIPAVNIEGPSSLSVCAGGDASFAVTVTPVGSGPHTYSWQKDGQPLVDDAHVTGSNGPMLTITGATSVDVGSYACIIAGPCGSVLSTAANLVVISSGTGDGDGSGMVDGLDIAGFVTAVAESPSATSAYCAFDMNADGVVDADDISGFIAVLLAQ